MTFWTIAKAELKITAKDKMFFLWLLVFPFLFSLIFGLAFRETSLRDQKVTLNIVDKDKSLLSQALISELPGEKYAVKVLENETESRVRTLIIPENFTKNILAGKKVELTLEKKAGSNLEASQSAYSNVLKAIIKILTKVVFIAPQNDKELEEKYNQTELERLITIKSEMAGKLQIMPSGFNHTIPAVSVMFILFTILMYGGINILQERRLGQLERIYLSPATFASIIGGKWLSRLLLGMLQIVLLFLVGKIVFNIYLGNSMLSLFLVALFLCGTVSGMSILFGSFIKKEEVLIVFNILVANLMASLGGCWWPIELVPSGLRTVSFFFPTGWAMDAFHKLIFFGYSLDSILLNVFVLFLFTVVFLILAIRFFKLRKV